VIASNDTVINQIRQTFHSGNGLTTTPEFKQLSRGVPDNGISFHFVSKTLNTEMHRLIKEASAADPNSGAPQIEFITRFLDERTPMQSFGVTQAIADGYVFTGVSSFSGAELIAAQVGVVPAAILAGMLMPALGKALTRIHKS